MKTIRFLLAAAIAMAAAACSAEVTAPDAVLQAPPHAHQNAVAPDSTSPAPAEEDDGGLIGSGVGR